MLCSLFWAALEKQVLLEMGDPLEWEILNFIVPGSLTLRTVKGKITCFQNIKNWKLTSGLKSGSMFRQHKKKTALEVLTAFWS